ncbi:hypothetical protein ACLKA7_009068 [Drosophila subpalustris]
MTFRVSIAILCLISANSLTHTASAGSGERVHIRLHMPEIVRKHTHFHKVYKLLPPPSIGKPHVSLLGYTTTASGTGVLSPNLMHVMASAATPMSVAPKYGPALFDNYNQKVEAATAATTTTPATFKPSGSSSYLATMPATASGIGSPKSPQQQLLQQIFTPNILAAISASQQQKIKHHNSNNNNIEMQSELELGSNQEPESEPEPELEHNELLNNNFLAALQHEYFNKFGSGTRKRKRVHFRSNYRRPPPPKKASNHVQDSDEHFDDYQEEDQPSSSSFGDDDEGTATGYDSAAAFSGQSNGVSFMPTVDEFLNDANSNSYAPFYGNAYDDYQMNSVKTTSEAIGNNEWHSSPPTFSSYARPTKATPPKLRLRQRRPSLELASGSGNASKVRYVKLATRKKRKNRIKSKRYRI